MVAGVVLPRPGGPESSTWSGGPRRRRAASTDTRRLSTAARCPTYSASRWGRSCRSTCVSSGRATRLITRASSVIPPPTSALSAATVDLVEQLLGGRHPGPAGERPPDDRGGPAPTRAQLPHHDVQH